MDKFITVVAAFLSCSLLVTADPCHYNPCWNGGTCDRTGDDYTCSCVDGFSGRVCETSVPTMQPPTTAAQTAAPTTLPPAMVCSFNPCFNGGSCYIKHDSYNCNCLPGFTGMICDSTYTVTTTTAPVTTTVDPCSFPICLNGGSCQNQGASYKCTCPAAYDGVVCDHLKPTTAAPTTVNPCANVHCYNGGTCHIDNSHPDGWSCRCPPHYTGHVCFIRITPKPTTPRPTTPRPTTPRPPSALEVMGNIGCEEADVVFMVEHMRGDSHGDVSHEADFIINLINGWRIDEDQVRVGLLVYDEEIKEHIHLDDYDGDKDAIIDKLENLDSQLGSDRDNNVADVLNYARDNMYQGGHHGAEKAAVVFVHKMTSDARREFHAAAERMRQDGITLYALGIDINSQDRQILQADAAHYFEFSDWNHLENSIPSNNFKPNCGHTGHLG